MVTRHGRLTRWKGALVGVLLVLGACGLERGGHGDARRSRGFASAAGSASLDAGPVRYRGGAVLSAPEITIVFWGDDVTPEVRSQTEALYRTLTEVDDFDWLTEYDTPSQRIGRARLQRSIVIHLADAGIQQGEDLYAELVGQIDAGVLPPPGENTYYAVYLPKKVRPDGSCRSWRAYHSTVEFGGIFGAWALFPDCGQRSEVAVHELFEAVTDPSVDGWNDDMGNEIGDLCEGSLTALILADGGTLPIQRLWSNRTGGCLGSEHEFDVALGPPNQDAAPTLTFEISHTEPLVPAGPVSFNVTGLPPGVTGSVAPGSTASSPWRLTLTLTPPYNSFQFTVEGRSDRWKAATSGDVFPPGGNKQTPGVTAAATTGAGGCSQAAGSSGSVAAALTVMVSLRLRRRRPAR